MIKINLLPEEFKKERRQKAAFQLEIPKVGPKVLKIIVCLLSFLIGLHLLLCISIFFKNVSLRSLESKWRKLEPNKLEIEDLNKDLASIEKVLSPIKQLLEERMIWSKELNQLSNLMTPGTWLTKLFVQVQIKDAQKDEYVRILNIEGCAASLYGDETALIAKFVKALQEDKEFFQYFKEIKLGPMEKTMLEKIPVMNFKVFCYFKERY